VLLSSVYYLLVTYETSFTCCLMTTCVTGIFYILVQIVMMNLKHSLSSSLILTLVTGKHVFFVTSGDELREESQVNNIYPIIIIRADAEEGDN
jgi:hypothetical protein